MRARMRELLRCHHIRGDSARGRVDGSHGSRSMHKSVLFPVLVSVSTPLGSKNATHRPLVKNHPGAPRLSGSSKKSQFPVPTTVTLPSGATVNFCAPDTLTVMDLSVTSFVNIAFACGDA